MDQQKIDKKEVNFQGGLFNVAPFFAPKVADSHVEFGMNMVVMQMPHNLNLIVSLPPEVAKELGMFLQIAAEAVMIQRGKQAPS